MMAGWLWCFMCHSYPPGGDIGKPNGAYESLVDLPALALRRHVGGHESHDRCVCRSRIYGPAFVFGMVHALMPGHGKTVLVSYHLGRPSR